MGTKPSQQNTERARRFALHLPVYFRQPQSPTWLEGTTENISYAIMPGTLIVEAIGQCASILFSQTTGKGVNEGEFLVLASINDMRFFVSVHPGHTMILEVTIVKMTGEAALVEGIVTVDGTVVTKGRLGFARKVV